MNQRVCLMKNHFKHTGHYISSKVHKYVILLGKLTMNLFYKIG